MQRYYPYSLVLTLGKRSKRDDSELLMSNTKSVVTRTVYSYLSD